MYVFIIRLTEKLSEDSQSRSLAKLLWLVQTWFPSAMSMTMSMSGTNSHIK